MKKLALNERHMRVLSRYRGGFFLPLLGFMFLCRWNEYENDPVIWTLGSVALLVSLSIRIWGTAYIGRRIPKWIMPHKWDQKELVKSGPYSIVRNPLYIANIIAMLGICVVFELLWFLPVTFLYLFALYSIVTRYEEEKLSRRFGQAYLTYKKRVPRWIPKPDRWNGEMRKIPWGPVLLGESRSCLLGILVLVLALFKELYF